ncbi:uncharacterized protein [Heptranchias perlo]|uniref:uncharacterized protein isoform X2 n=1 Tax=Heptranchias perlo TaxID=212740 RepID=UPI00355A7254
MCKGLATLPATCLERAKEVRTRLGFLLQKSDSTLSTNRTERKTRSRGTYSDEVLKWGESLDKLLDHKRESRLPQQRERPPEHDQPKPLLLRSGPKKDLRPNGERLLPPFPEVPVLPWLVKANLEGGRCMSEERRGVTASSGDHHIE